jgi:hypothetical protein
MSKKLLIILLIFGILFLFSLGISFLLLTTNQTIPFQKQQISKAQAPSILSFLPSPLILEPQKRNTISILLQAPTQLPQTIQLEIAYNPTVMNDIEMIPGDYFINPTVSLNTINPHTERISFVIESSVPDMIKKTQGTVAILEFTPNIFSPLQKTTLSFLPKTTIKDSAGHILPYEAKNVEILTHP